MTYSSPIALTMVTVSCDIPRSQRADSVPIAMTTHIFAGLEVGLNAGSDFTFGDLDIV